ncbi:unnamed protein product [Miscanthus lutarioriparius]|uniref:Dirigent protein n=1 Tax=Miscanthus lutarioriparius TaxID=422564 RepID=A0A811QBD5_9POAL|nr:unnamed protein product [Miscanthus lutarioriparius]
MTPLPGAPTTRFGNMYVIDDPLTEGLGAGTPAVGRAQGFYLFTAQHELAVMHCLNIVFTAGKQNGSYLIVQARDAILNKVRELPVIDGAGRFRGATDYGLLRTHSFNSSTNNAMLKIDMYLRL